MKISPSQLQTKRDCFRKWSFESLFRLPKMKKGYFAFGNVLHKVLERWLTADDNGRDKNGKTVDLYPKGWAVDTDRHTNTSQTLTTEEQILIKDLVQLAIEQGLVERTPGRLIEEYYSQLVVEGVLIHGYLDVAVLDELWVADHKTTKSPRYILSEAKLQADIKMRCYAIELAQRYYKLHKKIPASVTMRLNYMIKDPLKPKVCKREAIVSAAELEGEWERIEADATEMKKCREKYQNYLDFKDKPSYDTLDHEEIPGPEETNVCNAYGGCPYQNICVGKETVQQYFTRVNAVLNPKTVAKEKKMASIFQERLAERRKRKDAEAASEPVEQETSSKETEIESPASVTTQPPPWAEPKCTTCHGAGLDQHGEACPICFKLAKKAGLPLPADCRLDAATGKWIIEKKDLKPDEPESVDDIPVMGQDGSLKPPKGGKKKGNPLAEAKAKKKAAAKVEPEPEPEKSKPEPTKPRTSKPMGRPPMGYTLCIGTMFLRTGTREVIYAEKILDTLKGMISQDLAMDYDKIDSFKRRDLLAVGVGSLIDGFGAAIIICPNLTYATQDMRAMVEELKTHAQTISVPTGY